jgi:hypothetical protein
MQRNEREHCVTLMLFVLVQGVRWVAMGAYHTVAVSEAGVTAFGCNTVGQLGIGREKSAFQPVALREFASGQVASAACGSEHTLFLCKCDCLLDRRWSYATVCTVCTIEFMIHVVCHSQWLQPVHGVEHDIYSCNAHCVVKGF